jgi:uncharacterized protein
VRLYCGSTKQFVDDTVQHTIAEKLKVNFQSFFGYPPSVSELRSWQNSLQAVTVQLMYANLRDHGIILEMQLPLSSARLDCMITGHDKHEASQAVIVELKQWDRVEPSDVEDCVITWIGGRNRVVAHPSVQVAHYHQYLLDTSTVFQDAEGAVALSACGYAHNFVYDPMSPFYDEKFKNVLAAYPLFSGNQADDLATFLSSRLEAGNGDVVLNRVLQSRYRASKKLLEHTAAVIRGNPEYTLLDDQIVVFNTIMHEARKGLRQSHKAVVLVKGGPGTGKSLIALNVLGALSREHFNSHYATGSRAFTENLRKIVGSRAAAQFKYFNGYTAADPNDIDVLIMDEAHRIRENSNNIYTPKSRRSDKKQIDELIDAAKVAVFFIDDDQVVRPGEVGSSSLIRESAAKANATVVEEELRTQFRCAGSDAFVQWIDGVLGIRPTPVELWDRSEQFDFQIMDSPQALEDAIRAKVSEGFTGRLSAGFCWPWSDPRPDGTLPDDVVIDSFARPWNAKPDAGKLAAGIPRSHFWASDPNGISQVGCVYTAQGFEFDYIGIIFGQDLVFDPESRAWIGRRENSKDSFVVKRSKGDFVSYVKNVYRVLLTRGMKGCYVFFIDDQTRRHFEEQIIGGSSDLRN